MSRRRSSRRPRVLRDKPPPRDPLQAPPSPSPNPRLPARAPLPRLAPSVAAPATGWLWTCRAGFDAQLFEELAWAKAQPVRVADALIASARAPAVAPTFARTGFPISGVASSAEAAAALLPPEPCHVQVWVSDTDAGNRLGALAAHWSERLEQLRASATHADPRTPWQAAERGAWLGQVCVVSPDAAVVGQVRARDAVSLAAGGRSRMRRPGDSPSRAAMKLDEALDWLGLAPTKGDVCVDLGSAPGGWTRQLADRGAKVWSVDPARLAPDVLALPKVKHAQLSAFDFAPPEPVDWLFCDMAWRPLEVAQLLAKWGRKRWARTVVANLKLPMKDKLPVVLRCRAVLEAGGWQRVRTRQLYHDRDEITVSAVRTA